MTAEILREAARLMRERADETACLEPSPWSAGERCVWAANGTAVVSDGDDGSGGTLGPDHATHIASWHPAVALAVADWLEGTAITIDGAWDKERFADVDAHCRKAIAVARVYLAPDTT